MSTLQCKITKRKHNGEEIWEGTIAVQGVRPTKLTKSKSKETGFSREADVRRAADAFAKRHQYEMVKYDAMANSTKISKSAKTKKAVATKTSCSMSTPVAV